MHRRIILRSVNDGRRMFSPKKYLGTPTAATCAPGNCAFGEEFTAVPLLSRHEVSHDSQVLEFGLPDGEASLNLSTCACILGRGGTADDGNAVVRPYTPISTNAKSGSFELLVKVYDEGVMSKALGTLPIGDTIDFKHINFNVKIQYPFKGKRSIGMVVGGTGITPMIQALHAILGSPHDQTQVHMLYGSKTEEDILARDCLDAWCDAHSDQLSVTHVLSEGGTPGWTGSTGLIGRDLISQHLPGPEEGDSTMIFVCGPPPMYDALCGTRTETALSGALAAMGFSAEQIYKF